MRTSHWIAAIGMLVLLIILGGVREIVFVNVNEQMQFNDGLIPNYRVLDAFSFLKDYTNADLSIGKWILTVAFSLVFLLLSIVSFRYILGDPIGARWMIWTYIGAFVFAGLSLLLGKLLSNAQLGYTLSRVFMGALQSPFILMLMIPARRLAQRK